MRNLKKPEKKLFAYLFDKFKVKTDAELAPHLYTTPPVISRMRNDYKGLTPKMLLIIYDRTDLSIEEIRRMANEDVGDGKVLSGRKINYR